MERKSAVLLGLYNDNIILTKRSSNLRSFSGQICLPGGGVEPDDGDDPTIAAIREFSEEIAYIGNIETLFCLEKAFSPGANHFIYPIVAKLDGNINGFNPQEVEKIIYLKIHDLDHKLFSINPKLPTIKNNWCFNYENEFIWGITAYILKTFCDYRKYL